MSTYQQFHEWLNDCPTNFTEYKDNIDSITITFDTHKFPIGDEDFTADDVEKCIVDGNDYAECVDKLVESMGNNNNCMQTFIPGFHD